MLLPNRYRAPLTSDEELAECHPDHDRLIDLAETTGNRGLRAVAVGLKHEQMHKDKEDYRRGRTLGSGCRAAEV